MTILSKLLLRAMGGGSSLPPVVEKSFYFENFDAQADNVQLKNMSGWSSYSSLGSTNTLTMWKVLSGVMRYGTTGEAATTPGLFIIGRATGSNNHTLRFKIARMPDAGRVLTVAVAATHNQNAIAVGLTTVAGTTFQTLTIDRNVGGTATSLLSIGLSTFPAFGLNAVIDIQVISGKVYVYANSLLIGSSQFDGGGYVQGDIVGVGTRSAHDTGIDDVYIAPMFANLSVSATQIFWTGSAALGGRSVELSGAYVGTVAALQYRVLNAATKAVVQDWVYAASQIISGGTWSASCFVPLASLAVNPSYVVQLRPTNDTDAIAMTNEFTVGYVVSEYGQSNANNRNNGPATAYSVVNPSYVIAPRVAGWTKYTSAATTTSPAAITADVLGTLTGVPVGHIVIGWGAQPIDNLIGVSVPPSTLDSLWFDDLTALFDQYKLSGYVSAWNWTQGEAEANAALSVDEAAYRGKFDTALSLMRSLSAVSNAPVTVTIIGKANPPAATSFWGAMRAALYNLRDKPGVTIAHNFLGVPMVDDFHYTGEGYKEANRRTGLSLGKALGYTTYDGRGPLVTGATRAGATITLAVNLNGATSISGTGLNYYEVSTDNFATTLTVSSAAVSGGSIVITLAADPGAAVKVRSFYSNTYGNSPNPTEVLAVGAYADGSSIPVEPIYVPVTSN